MDIMTYPDAYPEYIDGNRQNSVINNVIFTQ